MNQKTSVLSLHEKDGFNAIHEDLVRTLGQAAVAYSTATKYV
jgi:hypothetical protein